MSELIRLDIASVLALSVQLTVRCDIATHATPQTQVSCVLLLTWVAPIESGVFFCVCFVVAPSLKQTRRCKVHPHFRLGQPKGTVLDTHGLKILSVLDQTSQHSSEAQSAVNSLHQASAGHVTTLTSELH